MPIPSSSWAAPGELSALRFSFPTARLATSKTSSKVSVMDDRGSTRLSSLGCGRSSAMVNGVWTPQRGGSLVGLCPKGVDDIQSSSAGGVCCRCRHARSRRARAEAITKEMYKKNVVKRRGGECKVECRRREVEVVWHEQDDSARPRRDWQSRGRPHRREAGATRRWRRCVRQ